MPFVSYLQSNPAIFYVIASVFGLIIGSFLNVVIHRLPEMMQRDWRQQCRILLDMETAEQAKTEEFSLVRPGSRCPHCGHPITPLENVPVLSYLLLGGKCSACKTPISVRYPVIEILSAFLAFFSAWHFGFSLQALLATVFSWALLTLTMIDLDHQILPDDIVLPLLWLGILANIFGVFTDIYSCLFGAMIGYGILWTVYILFKKVTGKEGMGYGDFKLLAMLGAWLGWQMLPLIILLSSLAGAIIMGGLIKIRRHDKDIPFAFGPYLALAGWIALYWGNTLTNAYLRWAATL